MRYVLNVGILKNIGKQGRNSVNDWKTTLGGIIGAAVTAAVTYYTQTGDTVNWQGYAGAIALAVLGYLAGDKQKKTANP